MLLLSRGSIIIILRYPDNIPTGVLSFSFSRKRGDRSTSRHGLDSFSWPCMVAIKPFIPCPKKGLLLPYGWSWLPAIPLRAATAAVDLLIMIVGYSIALWAVGTGKGPGIFSKASSKPAKSMDRRFIHFSGKEKKGGWAAHRRRLVTQTEILQSRLRRCRRPRRERPSSSFEISKWAGLAR